LAQAPKYLSDLGLASAAHSGVLKILAGLPAQALPQAEAARRRVYFDLTPNPDATNTEDIQWLPLLHDAVQQTRKLDLLYQRGDRPATQRSVDPLGLIARDNAWYMIANTVKGLRTFRVTRVKHAALREEHFDWPAGFDLERHWHAERNAFKAAIPRKAALVRAMPDRIQSLRSGANYARVEAVAEHSQDEQGRMLITLSYEGDHELYALLSGCGVDVELMEPAGLRAGFITYLDAIAQVYRSADKIDPLTRA
jgi:predicted DNA-binding transcriptional regulator YafY